MKKDLTYLNFMFDREIRNVMHAETPEDCSDHNGIENDLDFDRSGDSLQEPVSRKERRKSRKDGTPFKTQKIEAAEEEFRYPDIATNSVEGNVAGNTTLR